MAAIRQTNKSRAAFDALFCQRTARARICSLDLRPDYAQCSTDRVRSWFEGRVQLQRHFDLMPSILMDWKYLIIRPEQESQRSSAACIWSSPDGPKQITVNEQRKRQAGCICTRGSGGRFSIVLGAWRRGQCKIGWWIHLSALPPCSKLA
jgi:hypothetical protein